MPDPFKSAPGAREMAVATLHVMLEALSTDLTSLLLTPELRIDYGVIESYGQMLGAARAFGEAISTSNPGYWRRDLPKKDAEHLARAEHALTLLNATYAPAMAMQAPRGD